MSTFLVALPGVYDHSPQGSPPNELVATQCPPRFDVTDQSVMKLPEVLKDLGYKNPTGDLAIFQKAFGPDMNAFKFLGTHPSSLKDFNNPMAGQRFNRRDWFDFFPVQEKLFDGMKGDESALLVDVGGAQGFELRQFRNKFPGAKGKLILQALPNVIESIGELDAGIERMKHDFFTAQPVQGTCLSQSFLG